LLVFLSSPAAAQNGSGQVAGRVLDTINGQPLPGVAVALVGTATVVYTDLDGRYTITAPVGPQRLKVTLAGFTERTLEVEVAAGTVKTVDVPLSLAKFSEEISVTAEITAEAASTAALLLERKRASVITDNLGGQEMRANADGTAAGALQRVTGLSVVDNQFVFVRGLGERYSNTTLNGAMLPSTEPERKVVSLDMFPAGLLQSVSVVKSYTPDRSAEFAGGLIEIVPNQLPRERLATFSYSFGGNSLAWGKDVLDHAAGSRDWLGLSNHSRQLPAAFPDRRVIRGGIFTPELGLPQAELERLGEMLPNVWSPQTVSGRPYQGFSAAFGDRFGRIGLSASVNHSYKNDYQEEDLVFYSTDNAGTLSPFSTYDYRVGSNSATLAVLVNAAFAASSNHRLAVQGFTTDKGKRETRTFEGFNDDASRNLRNARLLWQEERLRTVQFNGDHLFPEMGNSRIDWRGSVSWSNRDEPDIRETLYEELVRNSGVFTIADESQSGLRMFNDLDERSWDVSASWNRAFTAFNGLPALIKFGPAFSQRDRDFSSRRFRFVPQPSVPGIVVRFDLTQSPEALFSQELIGTRFELREETRTTDFYGAEQRVAAGFGMIDLAVTPRARLIAGVRVENFRQTVDTFDLFDVNLDDNPETIRGEIKETDVFPAVNFVQDLGNHQNLRLSVSQTVNRPEFRELAPFEFTDIVGGRAVRGNPELTRSLIRNVDVRYEKFAGANGVLAASVFFKSFAEPIERVVEATAQLRTTYTNAQSARNLGLELEARRQVTDHLLVGGNYTLVDSSISLSAEQAGVLTTRERALAGTSKHLFNGLIEGRFDPITARLLINYFGDRIVDVGSLGLPDIFEAGRTTVDLVLSSRLGPRFSVRFAAENLTDKPVHYVQGSQTHRRFHLGRTFAVQFSVTR
jgi:hypothetical protein